eukprot:CAMPEP_0206183786 /NCGR_PEP_ID=MMETSP0166-20121206/841_1 /ASSEMBLY_ACC=CAM_ASM_000260 /TAXON_ID=95228 /ORGANISM="Vannella robusta, Strain DIVA3 518/3/11/1/6" /LENGTH=224 /DNA_ID=CAMNT_0053598699 /DNA_START=357 /DNA_END=1031 /DNA_ORIENTATION=+
MASIEATNHAILRRLDKLEASDNSKLSAADNTIKVVIKETTKANYMTSLSTWWRTKLIRDEAKLTVKTLVGTTVACRSVAPVVFSDSFYFEVIVLNAGEASAVAVGLIGEARQYLETMPGWYSGIGYHSDDGYLYKASEKGVGYPYGPIFQTGDVIGCGYDVSSDSLFFVKNGDLISFIKAPRLATSNDNRLYAAIGFQSNNARVSINFGGTDFLYKGVCRASE